VRWKVEGGLVDFGCEDKAQQQVSEASYLSFPYIDLDSNLKYNSNLNSHSMKSK
jgi:hypothetical protein